MFLLFFHLIISANCGESWCKQDKSKIFSMLYFSIPSTCVPVMNKFNQIYPSQYWPLLKHWINSLLSLWCKSQYFLFPNSQEEYFGIFIWFIWFKKSHNELTVRSFSQQAQLSVVIPIWPIKYNFFVLLFFVVGGCVLNEN